MKKDVKPMELMYTQKGKEPQFEVAEGTVTFLGYNEMTLPDHVGEKAAIDIAEAMGLTYYMLRKSGNANWYTRNQIEEALYVSPALKEEAEAAKSGLANQIQNMLNYLAGETLYEDGYEAMVPEENGAEMKQIILTEHQSGIHSILSVAEISVSEKAYFLISGALRYIRFNDEKKVVVNKSIWIGSLLHGRSYKEKKQINRVGIIKGLGEECPYSLLEKFMDKDTLVRIVDTFDTLRDKIMAAQEDARNYEAFKTLREIAK